MRSTQQKFIADVEKLAHDAGFELVQETRAGNQGRLMATMEDKYEPIVDFTYSFQSGYASFEGIANPQRAHMIPVSEGGTHTIDSRKEWPYTKFDELPLILKEISKILSAAYLARIDAELGIKR